MSKNSIPKITTVLVAVLFISACAASSQPVLYPNDRLQQVGQVQADVDKQNCMALADNYVKEPNKYLEMGKTGAIGAGVGAGAGAIAGVITKGAVGRATAAGAAVGSIVGIATEARKQTGRTPSYERFVEHCLQKKGYEVTGWQ